MVTDSILEHPFLKAQLKNQAVVTPEVWKGTQKTAKLGRVQPIVLAVPAGMSARIKTAVARPDPLIAPLTKGQQVGTLKVSSGDQQLLEVPPVRGDPTSSGRCS